ncbi:MAG: alpha/beta hydrolase-fold protein [Terricaulis sp.]
MRKVLVLIVAVVAGLTLAGAAWIAVGVSPRFPERASNGVDYILYTDVPSACTRRSPCPVIYLLDGERWFSSTRDALHGLVGARRAPPVVLVGIGYQNIARTAALRKRDFTPDFGGASGATGGADAYLRVLRDELMPYAERTMPIDPSRRVLAGHSYAGLFATHALIEAPDLFEATVIVSPALWFGDYATFERNLPATRQAHLPGRRYARRRRKRHGPRRAPPGQRAASAGRAACQRTHLRGQDA